MALLKHMVTGWVRIVFWCFNSLDPFNLLRCSKGHQRKLAGKQNKKKKGFVVQPIIDPWNLLQKDLVSGKSLHGSGGQMDKYLEGKSTVD